MKVKEKTVETVEEHARLTKEYDQLLVLMIIKKKQLNPLQVDIST
jgi:hypothetical protein